MKRMTFFDAYHHGLQDDLRRYLVLYLVVADYLLIVQTCCLTLFVYMCELRMYGWRFTHSNEWASRLIGLVFIYFNLYSITTTTTYSRK